jgi:hypothetical protein
MNDSKQGPRIVVRYHPNSTPPHLSFGGISTSVCLSPATVATPQRITVTTALTNGLVRP